MGVEFSLVEIGGHTPPGSRETTVTKVVPLVSVVIPTHERAQLLKRAISSVLAQTYSRLEIIVVDDASRDNTREVVESFGDSRIRYFQHQTNKGGSAARNTGIRNATGEFIAFLDDDDEWEPEKTEEQIKVLQDCDVVLCASTEPGSSLHEGQSKETVDPEDLRRGKFTGGGTGVLMAKGNVLKETMFDESLPRYQDWDFFIRIALKHKIVYLNKALVRYNAGTHRRITNSILDISASELEQQFRMVHKHRQFFGRRLFKRHMCRSLLYGIKHRRDKVALLAFTARRYGAMNVACLLVERVAIKLRDSFPRVASTETKRRGSQP